VADGIRYRSAHNNIGDSETATGLEDAEGFAEDAILVRGKVDDTVRNDDVNRVVGEGDVLDFAFEELDVGDAGLALILAGEGEHVVGHVEAIGFPGWANAPCGEEHIDTAARAEIEHDFTRCELDQRGGIAAAERSKHCLLRDEPLFIGAVEVGRDGVATAKRRIAASLYAAGSGDGSCGAAVFFFDLFLNIGGLVHWILLFVFVKANISGAGHICQCVYYECMSSRAKSPDLVPLFAAFADRTRLRLLNLIAGREVCVCYLVEILRQGQPKISRHLAYLRKAGVVAARREGKWMHYRIQRPGDAATAFILDAVLESFKSDREMESDLARLSRACCEPQRFVSLQGAPVPVRSATATA